MTPALLGKKIGMTRIYDDKGAIVPVTVVQAGPCAVTQVSDESGGARPTFYQAKADFEGARISGLVSRKRGPSGPDIL